MLLRYENKQKKTTNLQNVVLKPRKIIVEWILSAIRKSFKSCALITALDGDENDQSHCFQAEILIDEDEEGDEEIDVLSRCITFKGRNLLRKKFLRKKFLRNLFLRF